MDLPCTKSCNRKEHGDFIVAALTKRAVNDIALSAFLNYTCELCGSSRDSIGRTALHMAASCGRTDVCKWLICQKQAKIDEKDTESGYTALHRSIFYGKIDTAVSLIQLGANFKILDSNDLSPLDHAMQDNLAPVGDFHSQLIYVWGVNTNYTLGPKKALHYPELMDNFHNIYPELEPKQIYIEKFYTMILTSSGEVFAFGHGQGGRLGIGNEKTILEPTKVKVNSNSSGALKITSCAIARDHCLFLTSSTEVWSCGLNMHHVLGIAPPPIKLLTPCPVSKLKVTIEGIAGNRYHSIAWNSHSIFTWGFNGGQLGHSQSNEETIILPKIVTCLSSTKRRIISVATSLGATGVVTDKGDVYLLYEYQCQVIASKILDITSISIYGGKLSKINDKKEDLCVLVLTRTGNMLIWQETDPHMCRCTFSLNRLLIVQQVCLHANGLIFVTAEKEIFNGKLRPRKNKTVLKKKHFNHFLERNECVLVRIEKVPRIYGANSVICDPDGKNFAAIHLNTAAMMMRSIPDIGRSTANKDFGKMISSKDIKTDVKFKVDNRVFPAHRYIIHVASDKLGVQEEKNGYVSIENVEPEIFHEILDYVYTGRCSLLKEGPIPQQFIKFNRTQEKKNKTIAKGKLLANKLKNSIGDPVRLLQEAAKKLGICQLYKDLSKFVISTGKITLRDDMLYNERVLEFNRLDFPELYDVRIMAECGESIEAHKFVLVARCEFFSHMFSMRWMLNESRNQTVIELPFSIECIRQLLDYLYTDRVDMEKVNLDQILRLLILGDHLLLNRLVEICELAASKMLTVKNVLRILVFAEIYNAKQLKEVSLELICLNLALLLETRHLEQLDEVLLKDLTKFYAKWNAKMQYRVITPFSDATSDEMIENVSAKYPVKMDFTEIIKMPSQKMHRRRNRTHRNSSNLKSSLENSWAQNENIQDSLYEQGAKVDMELNSRLENQLIVESTMPVRIRAILKAEVIDNDNEEDFANLSLSSENDFPTLNSSSECPTLDRVHLQKPVKLKGKILRLPQKERKRLASETLVTTPDPESPKNPWNTNFETATPSSSTLDNIISEEKRQKVNLTRIRSKLLFYTQMEDKAMEDLAKFYNVENVFDEIIEVHRVDYGELATPVWIHN